MLEDKIYAPMTGKLVPIEEVDDPVFAERMVGDGIVILPSTEEVVAPCDGELINIFPTNHAIGMLTPSGFELLIHIGINTVELKGRGFQRFAELGQVKKGERLMGVDLSVLKKSGCSLLTPCIITSHEKTRKIEFIHSEHVTAGIDPVMLITRA